MKKPNKMKQILQFAFSVVCIIFIPVGLMSQNVYNAYLSQPDPIEVPSICIVSTSLSNKNIVVWEKTNSSFTGYFGVYRESTSQSNQWDLVDLVPYGDYSVYTDQGSNPSNQAYNYRISAIDTCGNETELSDSHKTMNLSIAQGINNSYSLIWSEYEGFTVNNYNIYRGKSESDLEKIATTAAGNFNYNDNNPPAGDIYYQIEIISPNICDPSIQKSLNTYSTSRSNIVSSEESTSITYQYNNAGFLIYPNPMKENLHVKVPVGNTSDYILSIFDLTGKKVYEKSGHSGDFEFNRGDLPKGLYIIEIQGTDSFRNKLIIND
jgi:hypothetical protein